MSTNQTPTPSVLLIGGPDAGKSNYLFRLWLAVDTGAGALVKDKFPDELEYLRTGLETLLRGEFAGRTSGEVLEHVTIPVKSAQEESMRGILNVPDVREKESREFTNLANGMLSGKTASLKAAAALCSSAPVQMKLFVPSTTPNA